MAAGDIWFQAFSNFGHDMSRGIGTAFQEYQQREQRLKYSDALMHELSQTVNPATGKPVLDEKAYVEYLNHSDKERAMVAGAKLGSMQMLGQMQKSAANAYKTTAQTVLANTRAQGVQVDIAQKLGLIPKVQQPPTGGQIVMEQRAQRKERFNQRKELVDTIYNEKPIQGSPVNDPQMLLDPNALSYLQKGKMYGYNPAPDPNSATHVQIEDGPIFTMKQFNRLQQHAQKWQALGQMPTPQLNVPPQAAQLLLQNPNPQMKAFFDQKFGKGAADTVIAATQPAATPAATPEPSDTDTETPDEESQDTDEP